MKNRTGTLPAVGPFDTFRDYLAGVRRKTVTPRRAPGKYRPVAKGPGQPGHRRVTLVPYDVSLN